MPIYIDNTRYQQPSEDIERIFYMIRHDSSPPPIFRLSSFFQLYGGIPCFRPPPPFLFIRQLATFIHRA
ncbi:hypothetical protein B4113_2067 [Geobacillus sp. B4113_201601]|nr:hypothetical protein B4113_2067 [Geobacillus sp. B4113_201601]